MLVHTGIRICCNVHFHVMHWHHQLIIFRNKTPSCCWDSRSYCVWKFDGGSLNFEGSGSVQGLKILPLCSCDELIWVTTSNLLQDWNNMKRCNVKEFGNTTKLKNKSEVRGVARWWVLWWGKVVSFEVTFEGVKWWWDSDSRMDWMKDVARL